MIKLGVNVDHVATLRAQRGTPYPDPAVAALCAEYAGCDSVVVHVREDRRHINEHDAVLIKKVIKIPLNLEMSVNNEIVVFALNLLPAQATLVPERRRELTTESGLNLSRNQKKISRVIQKLKQAGIKVSLFIDPAKPVITQAKALGADLIELNTGSYSESKTPLAAKKELARLKAAAEFAQKLDFFVAAGHGLDYENVKAIVKIKEIAEFNIGHALICRSVFIGLFSAVKEMLSLVRR